MTNVESYRTWAGEWRVVVSLPNTRFYRLLELHEARALRDELNREIAIAETQLSAEKETE